MRLESHAPLNSFGGGYYIFIRRLTVLLITSILLVCVSGICAGRHAYADEDLPYEIRATIITTEDYDGLYLTTPGGFLGLGAQEYHFTQDNLVSSQDLDNGFHKYTVVYQVDKQAPNNHRMGKKVTYRLENDNNELGDFQELTIKKDDQQNVYYSEFIYKETATKTVPFSFIDEKNNTLVARKEIDDFPILLNGAEDIANISLNDNQSANVAEVYVELKDDGSFEASIEPSLKVVGTTLSINGSLYTVQSVAKQGEGIVAHVKKVETVTKNITFTVKRPYTLGKADITWKISSDIASSQVKTSIPEGKDDIVFTASITYKKDNPSLKLEMLPNAMRVLPWYGAANLMDENFDAQSGTYTATLARTVYLKVISLKKNTSYVSVGRAPLVKNLNFTLKDAQGTTVDAQVQAVDDYSGGSYILHNIVPGAYTFTLSSNDEATRNTYDLRGVYRVKLTEDGVLSMNHLGDGKDQWFYAPGSRNNMYSSANDYALAGTKTKFTIALANKPRFEKSVRVLAKSTNAAVDHTDDALEPQNAPVASTTGTGNNGTPNQFASSVYANVGDTVEYDVAIKLPQNYNLTWKFGTSWSAGLLCPLSFSDTIDPRLKVDPLSIRVLDSKNQAVNDVTAMYDPTGHTISVHDKRAPLISDTSDPQDLGGSFTKEFSLRPNTEEFHLHFSATITSFKKAQDGKEENINNVVEDSKTTITPYTRLSVKKLWHDAKSNELADVPTETYVQLLANGTAQGDKVKLDKQNNWQHMFSDLPTQDKEGKNIKYTVVEVGEKDGSISIDDKKYQVVYETNDGITTITNKAKPVTPPVPPTPPAPEPPAPTPEPPTPEPPAPQPEPAPVPSLPLPQPQLQIPAARLVPAETLQAPAVTPMPEPAPAPATPAPALPQTGDECAPAALLGSIAAFLSISFCALGLALHTRTRVRG